VPDKPYPLPFAAWFFRDISRRKNAFAQRRIGAYKAPPKPRRLL